MMRTDLAIIGAGPAGMAAAFTAAGAGLSVTVIDEQARAGGQILRQPPASFKVDRWLSERIYRPQQQLLQQREEHHNLHWLHSTTVLGVDGQEGDLTVILSDRQGVTELRAQRLLIATGCHDMSVSFPGSLLPGVMATGGIQAFVKSQQIVPGERFVFSGTHPLQLIVADQILQAGGQVEAVLFSQPLSIVAKLLKHSASLLRYPGKMLYFNRACARLLKRGVAIQFGRTVSRAHGEHHLERVDTIDTRNGEFADSLNCDRLGIGFGFLANSQLANQAGLDCYWSDSTGGSLARVDEWMRSSVPGIYAAGEITGIGGADVSQSEGEIAGLAVAMDAGLLTAQLAKARARPVRKRLRPLYRFATLLSELSQPDAALLRRLMTDDSILCKCEEVSVGALRGLLQEQAFTRGINAIKLQSRCGMGMCQGRYCQYPLRTLLDTQAAAEGFQVRFPIKPLSLGNLANTSQDSGSQPEQR